MDNKEESLKLDVSIKTDNHLSEEYHLKKMAVESATQMIVARINKNIHLNLDDIEKRFPIMYDIVYNKIKVQG
jgi:hypothetical protein